MFALTFAQMRRSVGRLTAAGIAIAIGSAFVAVTLLAGNLITRTTYDSVSAGFAKADVVVIDTAEYYSGDGREGTLNEDQIEKIRAVPGIDTVLPEYPMWEEIQGPKRSDYLNMIPISSDDRLNPFELSSGRLPESDSEIALSPQQSERLGAGVGDTVTIKYFRLPSDEELAASEPLTEEEMLNAEAPEEEEQRLSASLTVTGIIEDPSGAYASYGGTAAVTLSGLIERSPEPEDPIFDGASITLAKSADRKAVIEAINSVVTGDTTLEAMSRDAAAKIRADNFTGGEDVLTRVILGFAALALLVAGLVISNTFQVLVAQRTRTLAMLRCIGAKKGQLRWSVRLEAAILALIASAAGILLGCGFGQGALMVLQRFDFGVPLPKTISVTPDVIWLPIVSALVVTVIAAMAPAAAATRVSPLQALRPAEAPSIRKGGLVRLIISILLFVAGVAFLVLGILWSTGRSPELALLVGVAGGALSFIGIIVGAVFWLPRVAALLGKLFASAGASGQLAAANTVRNPRRTAATSTALLIGVTLVVMMSTGAISARSTLAEGLDDTYPVDIQAVNYSSEADEAQKQISSARTQVDANENIEASAVARSTWAEIESSEFGAEVKAIDIEQAAKVARSADALAGIEVGQALVPKNLYGADVKDGEQITLTPMGDSTSGKAITLRAKIVPSEAIVITQSDMDTLDPDAPVSEIWMKVKDGADIYTTTTEISDIFADTGFGVTGAVAERAMFEQVINILLGIVIGLLAVAVVIALIGVANTLSLSVIERQRENAMLRAIGLSRRQLRLTLAFEGILIAVVGTLLGAILGVLYGWAGATIVFIGMGDVVLAVPWTEIVVALVVALVAGLLASVLPARRAARTSPVAALAVD